jgi:hypothetical protein
LHRRKPFDKEGQRGFRDALQWEAILDVVQKVDGSVVLVTSNRKDFGEHGSLEKHLAEDLNAINKTGSVTVCVGLDEFLQQYAEPELDKLDDISQSIVDGQYKSLVTDDLICGMYSEIEREIRNAVREDDLRGLGALARQHFSEPKLESLDDEFKVIDVDVFRVDEGNLAISVTVAINGTIGCKYYNDAYRGPDEPPDHWIEVHSGDAEFTVRCGAIISEATGDVQDESIDHVDINLGRDWDYLEYDG